MADSTCYWPNNGGRASGFTRCNSGSGSSACCASSHYCFSNGLCLDPTEMTTYRGACTDESWDSAACPRFCLVTSGGGVYTSVCGVWACNNNNQFACDNTACGNSTEMFTVNGGTIQQNAAFSDVLSSTSSGTSTTSATASSTSNVQISSSIATCTPAAGGQASSADASCPSNVGAYAGIGAGLGVPLLIALVALVFMFLQLRKHKRQQPGVAEVPSSEQKYTQPPPTVSSSGYESGYYSPTPAYKQSVPPGELPSMTSQQGRQELGA